jgi:hypothetical protein
MKLFAATTLALGAEGIRGKEGTMREAFDALTRFGKQLPLVKYPEDKWTAITECMATAGPTLWPTASDAAWDGWTQFGITGGTADDPWTDHNPSCGFNENDPRNLTFQGHKFPIIEPCNTVSNLAYYRIVPDLCNMRQNLTMSDEYATALISGFATLGMGSSFMHGSRTHLGSTFDNVPIAVIAYQYQQLMTDSLKVGANGTDSILHEISATPRAYDGRTLANKLITVPLDFEIADWNEALQELDVPDYFFTFSTIIVNGLTLILPDAVADEVINIAIALFSTMLPPDVKDFLTNKYLPNVRGAMDQFQLTLKEKEALVPVIAGTIMKLLWAFVWQEQTFLYPFIFDAKWNLIGNLLTPPLFALANKLTKFPHDDLDYQKQKDIYPGQAHCNIKAAAPHAKWHDISATGLMDMAFMSDYVRQAIDIAQARGPPSYATSADEVFIKTDIFDEWAAESAAENAADDWTSAGLVAVVKDIVNEADSCSTGVADGSITYEDLACFLRSVDSYASFIKRVYDGVSAYDPEVASVMV